MAGAIPQSFIDTILERTDLPGLLRERMSLKKSGATLTGCCPFHDEKTPSFHVYHQAHPQHYHCYGCGAHGDAIALLRELDHLSFVEAVEVLARRLGLEVPRDEAVQRRMDERKPLFDVLSVAQSVYREYLLSHPEGEGARYLARRGVDEATAELFGLGEAPADRAFLTRRLNPALKPAAEQVRLLIRREADLFDLFSYRLMFPIRDTRGRIVGFGGRTLGDDRSKYINSPESPVFHKSQVLYGLWENRQRFRQLDRLLVVEGYLDVISLLQHGVAGAVATMGTATNEDNLNQLLTHSRHLVFCFDGDPAGLKAADKALANILPLLKDGDQIRFLVLPDGDDPDTLVRRIGGDAFEALLSEAQPLSAFLFDRLAADLDLSVPEQRGEFNRRGREMLARMKDNREAPVLRNGLWEALRERTRSRADRERAGRGGNVTVAASANNFGAAQVAWALASRPDLVRLAEPLAHLTLRDEKDKRLQRCVRWMLENDIDTEEELAWALCTRPGLRKAWQALLAGLEIEPDPGLLERLVRDAVLAYQRKYLDVSFEHVQQSLRERPDDPELKTRLVRLMEDKARLARAH
ncbi:DNA primase [Hahella sp. SMD15-11]|uniref:DNA primase n=1 Tax=Thermohahella caldifontis TaxID=3142973 RepID=A0AB39URA2_9GAMM